MFPLGFTPMVPGTVEVRVDGTTRPSAGNWTYDGIQNAVIFDPGREPQLGEQIEITYAAGC